LVLSHRTILANAIPVHFFSEKQNFKKSINSILHNHMIFAPGSNDVINQKLFHQKYYFTKWTTWCKKEYENVFLPKNAPHLTIRQLLLNQIRSFSSVLDAIQPVKLFCQAYWEILGHFELVPDVAITLTLTRYNES